MTCKDRVAIVTGAAGGGMGRSIALTLAREGASVVVNYRTSAESAQEIVDHLQRRGASAIAVQADIFDPQGCKQLVQATREHFGQVDICIVSPGGGWHAEPIDRLEPAAALEDLHHEVAPLFYLMPLVLPGMYEQQWGRLVGIALHPTHSSPAYAYNVGKAARMHALLLAQDQAWVNGVTVNVIAPGPVSAIESLADAIEQCDHGSCWEDRANASPQDVAEGVAFLCSEGAKFVTGCVLPYWFRP